MQARSVGVGVHYPIPIHRQEAFQPLLKDRGEFPVTERLASEVLSLPSAATSRMARSTSSSAR